jgi:hypothetical protein
MRLRRTRPRFEGSLVALLDFALRLCGRRAPLRTHRRRRIRCGRRARSLAALHGCRLARRAPVLRRGPPLKLFAPPRRGLAALGVVQHQLGPMQARQRQALFLARRLDARGNHKPLMTGTLLLGKARHRRSALGADALAFR